MVTASYITPHPAEFNDMREDLERERRFMGKQWSKREAQILAVVDSTVGMVGDLQGIAGKAMPEIPSLDIPLLEAATDPQQAPSHQENFGRALMCFVPPACPRSGNSTGD